MKEWAIKHPILTFLLIDSAIAGVVNVIRSISCAVKGGEVKEENKIECEVEAE